MPKRGIYLEFTQQVYNLFSDLVSCNCNMLIRNINTLSIQFTNKFTQHMFNILTFLTGVDIFVFNLENNLL